MRVQGVGVANCADVRCVVLASVARIVDCPASVGGCRTDLGPALRKVRAAVDEALTAGIAQVEVAPTIGDAPFGAFLARHETIAAETAKVVVQTLRGLLTRSGIAGDRVRFVNDGVPTSAAAALASLRRSLDGQATAVLVPHELRCVEAACLRELVAEYDQAREASAIVAATVGMDDVPAISWLARRGRRVFARYFEAADAVSSEFSELRFVGRCILPPAAIRACARVRSRHGRALTLVDVLNSELASGRPVVAREFARGRTVPGAADVPVRRPILPLRNTLAV